MKPPIRTSARTRGPADRVLHMVVGSYLGSADFHGMLVPWPDLTRADGRALERLIRNGDVEVIAEVDFPNPHIRPWSSRRRIESQVSSLRDAIAGKGPICLYPTRQALVPRLKEDAHRGAPYKRRMAEGAGALDVLYFTLDVLEPYRNDPRYHLFYWDFGLELSIGDEAFEDELEPEKDKVSMKAGFAYLFPNDKGGPIQRFACAFYTDLAGLSAEHQLRWSSYEVLNPDSHLHPHPQWWAAMMGRWPDGIGPFGKLRAEIDAVNHLFETAFGEQLFKSVNLPSGFHWVLRPSQAEWDTFVSTFDKVLSENIRHEAMDAMHAPRTGQDGKVLGTLARFEYGLSAAANVNPAAMRKVFPPLREIHPPRSQPPHHLTPNLTAPTIPP